MAHSPRHDSPFVWVCKTCCKNIVRNRSSSRSSAGDDALWQWAIEQIARLGPNPDCGLGPFPYRQPDLNATPDCSLFQYWSLHQGGANFAFADGSVRFLAYSADPILGALASRAGGEVPETIE